MKDILKKAYLINVEEFNQYDDGIIFMMEGSYYYFTKTIYDESYLKFLSDIVLDLRKEKKILHDFVLNKDGLLNTEGYVLFKLNCFIDEIDFDDIKQFAVMVNSDKVKEHYLKMQFFWENKIDYLELQLSELSDNKLVNNSFDYYVGIAEILIKFLKNNDEEQISRLYLSHKIFRSKNTIDFYNPLNLTFDYYLRDIAYYIKINNDWNLLYELLDNYKFSNYEYCYLFVRLVFPYDYFYCLEDVVVDQKSEEGLLKVINNNDKYEKYLFEMESLFNIYLFSWLKKE